jgi:recombination protein RecR
MDYPPKVQALITAFRSLPSVGPRSAERFAQWLLKASPEISLRLEDSIKAVREEVRRCPDCGFYMEGEGLCAICSDPGRNRKLWCVVEDAAELIKIERSGVFCGLYHILGGLIDPLEGIEPDHLEIQRLLARLERDRPDEVILALGTDVESETTLLYLTPEIKARGVKVSRLAMGLPAGGALEYADSVTLGYALAGRKEVT